MRCVEHFKLNCMYLCTSEDDDRVQISTTGTLHEVGININWRRIWNICLIIRSTDQRQSWLWYSIPAIHALGGFFGVDLLTNYRCTCLYWLYFMHINSPQRQSTFDRSWMGQVKLVMNAYFSSISVARSLLVTKQDFIPSNLLALPSKSNSWIETRAAGPAVLSQYHQLPRWLGLSYRLGWVW